jgi:hypothetical protein
MFNKKKYTEDYFDMDFSKFKHLLESLNVTNDLQSTDCPVVEVNGLNVIAINNLLTYCKNNFEKHFIPVEDISVPQKWYSSQRSHGWTTVTIRDQRPTSNDSYLTKQVLHDDTALKYGQDIFGSWWNCIDKLRILCLDSSGWCFPHCDIRTDIEYGLCNFWIPLHEFPSNGFKIFPLGFLQHRVGSMYLFNQSKFPHAIRNIEIEKRYVLVGKFSPTSIPGDIHQIYQRKKFSYGSLFKAE